MIGKKIIIFLLIIIGIIFIIWHLKNPASPKINNQPAQTPTITTTPTTQITPTESSIPENNQTCKIDSDCNANETCVQSGPIVLDPVTKKPLPQKICLKKDSVVPF